MPSVVVTRADKFEVVLRNFRRKCDKAGILSDVRRHEFYEKPTWKRKRKKSASRKRLLKKIQREKLSMDRGRRKQVRINLKEE